MEGENQLLQLSPPHASTHISIEIHASSVNLLSTGKHCPMSLAQVELSEELQSQERHIKEDGQEAFATA